MRPRKSQSQLAFARVTYPCTFSRSPRGLLTTLLSCFERTINHHSTTTNSMLDRSTPKTNGCVILHQRPKEEHRARSGARTWSTEVATLCLGPPRPHTRMGVTPSVKKRRFSSTTEQTWRTATPESDSVSTVGAGHLRRGA